MLHTSGLRPLHANVGEDSVDVAGVESLDRRRRLPARPAHRAAVADLAAGQSARRLGTPQGRQAHRGPAPSRRHGSAVSRLAVHHLELDRAYIVWLSALSGSCLRAA